MPWYVVRTKPNAEDRIEAETAATARKAGVELLIYIPRETRLRTVRHGRQEWREEVKRPLFPGYAFASFDTDEAYHVVKGTAGVVGYIGPQGGAKPWEVASGDIEGFRQAEAEGLFDFTPKKREFIRGQKVRISHGPFTGFKAKFLSKNPHERVRVLMQSLIRGGPEREVSFPIGHVEIDAEAA